MAGTGGARPGAGRPKGVPNKKNQRMIELAKRKGILPHQLLLKIAQTGYIKHNGERILVDVPTRLDCAKSAAPYYAPKLQQIEAKIDKEETHYYICDKPLDIEEFNAKYGISLDTTAETENIN